MNMPQYNYAVKIEVSLHYECMMLYTSHQYFCNLQKTYIIHHSEEGTCIGYSPVWRQSWTYKIIS